VPISVDHLRADEVPKWEKMRRALGPDWLVESFSVLVDEYLSRGTIQGLPHAVLLARDDAGSEPLGFAEVSIREFAEGCLTSPVGYLEGWYVAEHARRRGVGAALLAAGERWAASKGCSEFASDAELDNPTSLDAHAALGFEPVADIRCFRKSIGG
jgi:aminoglycoside 6'-N-acetyltransferase I